MSAVKDTKKRRRTKIAVLTTAFVVVASGAAYAYWTNSGSGTGTAATGTNAAVTVVQTIVVDDLYPGRPTRRSPATSTNPNPGNTYVTAVTCHRLHDRRRRTGGLHRRAGRLHAGRRPPPVGDVPRPRPGLLVGPDHRDEQPRHQPGRLQGRHGDHHLRQQLTEFTSD